MIDIKKMRHSDKEIKEIVYEIYKKSNVIAFKEDKEEFIIPVLRNPEKCLDEKYPDYSGLKYDVANVLIREKAKNIGTSRDLKSSSQHYSYSIGVNEREVESELNKLIIEVLYDLNEIDDDLKSDLEVELINNE